MDHWVLLKYIIGIYKKKLCVFFNKDKNKTMIKKKKKTALTDKIIINMSFGVLGRIIIIYFS